MTNTITLAEPSVDSLTSTWTGLRLERGPNATNLAAFALVTLIPYVSGQTSYTYVDAAGASSDWYRVARYGPVGLLGTYSPAWPVTPQSVTGGNGARRSRKNCRRVLARRLSSLQIVTTTADGNTAGTTLQSTQLATQTDADRYFSWFAMPTDGVSAGQIRVISRAALNPQDGTVTITPAYLSQIVRGTQVEFHKLLPPDEFAGLIGLNQALNAALAECWVIDRLALAGLSNTVTYDISTFGDWLDEDAIHEFYGPAFGQGIPLYPWGGFNARRDGAVLQLDVAPGISAGAAMQVELTRPGDTFIKVGGVWTDNQQGFQNDDDECLFQPVFLAEVGLVYCLEQLRDSTTGAASNRYAVRAEDQRKRVNIAKYRGLPHPPERSDHNTAAYQPNDWWSWLK